MQNFGPKMQFFGPKPPFFRVVRTRLNGIISPPYPEATLDNFGFPVGGRLAARRAVFRPPGRNLAIFGGGRNLLIFSSIKRRFFHSQPGHLVCSLKSSPSDTVLSSRFSSLTFPFLALALANSPLPLVNPTQNAAPAIRIP